MRTLADAAPPRDTSNAPVSVGGCASLTAGSDDVYGIIRGAEGSSL